MRIINAAGAAVTPALTLLALAQSGLHWVMSDAQRLSLEMLTLYSTIEINRAVSAHVEKFSVSPLPNTLCGIPYTIDDTLDRGWLELRLGAEVLIRIESLAIPARM